MKISEASLRVGFNNTPLKSGHQSRGIGFYTRNLLKELKMIKGLEVVELSGDSTKDVDLVHIPFFDFFFRTLSIKISPTVVTVLDVTPLIFPQAYPAGIKGKFKLVLQRRELKKATAIITISEQSKKDISKYLGINQDKIFVTYLAAESRFRVIEKSVLKKISERYHLPEKFALYIGNVNWNKNLLNLTRASLEAGLDLVLVGKSFEQKENLDHPELSDFKEWLIIHGNDSRVHILGFVSDEDIVDITNLASLLLFPSRYEGFGMPILEAQQCGVPVITSNRSSLPEVAGDSALLVNPEDSGEITEAIKRILTDSSLKQTLIKKGFENAKRFSWQKCAQETYEVYQRIVNER